MKISLPLNNIRDENVFNEYRSNLIAMWESEPALAFYGYSAAQMFNHIWCSLNRYVYICGEKYEKGMKYFIMGEVNDKGEYIGTTVYINPEFPGNARRIMGAALIGYGEVVGATDTKIYSYTLRDISLFLRIFKEYGAEREQDGDYEIGGNKVYKYSMRIGSKYKKRYEEFINA